MKRFYRRLVQSSLSLLVIGFLALPSQATTVVMLSDDELVVTSRFIVTGEVRSVFSAWDDARSMIWTYVEIGSDRVLKGDLQAETIVLKQPGGTVGQSGMYVFGQPQFLPGREVLLYLSADPEGNLRVAHSFMGMFSIREDDATGEKFVTRPTDEMGVMVLARPDNKPVTDLAWFSDYVRKIEETLQRESAAIAQMEAARANHLAHAVPAEYYFKRAEATDFSPHFALFGDGIRWMEPDSGQPVIFQVNPDRSPVSGGAMVELIKAMDAWRFQSGAGIRLLTGGQTSKCGSERDNVNTISFGDCKNQLEPPSGCSGVLAQATVTWSSETKFVNGRTFKRILESDIVFNKGMDCFLANSANLAEVACHELGHSIGLNHSSDNSAIMRAFAYGNGRDATLGADDIEGVLSIYPAAAGGSGPAPVITKVKVKNSKKLIVTGQNFSQNSLIMLNGATIAPKSFNSEQGKLKWKGALTLKPAGTNTIIVLEGSKSSAMFTF